MYLSKVIRLGSQKLKLKRLKYERIEVSFFQWKSRIIYEVMPLLINFRDNCVSVRKADFIFALLPT